DAEEVGSALAIPGADAALHPPRGPRQRGLVVGAGALRGRALVEGHDDVGTERLLHLDRDLGREALEASVDVGAESDAVLVDLAGGREGVDLEAAGVGE